MDSTLQCQHLLISHRMMFDNIEHLLHISFVLHARLQCDAAELLFVFLVIQECLCP
ncbi:hypothetical protein D3C84_1031420 [compost metagenome]